jgi:hypothetical protein
MSALDIREAKRSLAWWLREWGVLEDSERKARQFIDDMVDRGWQMAPEREVRPIPPRRDQDCKRHPGQHASHCGLCRVEKYGADDEPVTDEDRRLVETIRARREGKL